MDKNLEFLFVDEAPLEPDDSEDHLGNEPDVPRVPNDGANTVYEPIHRTHSRHLREKLGPGDLVTKVRAVLAAMKQADWYPRALNVSSRAFCKIFVDFVASR